MGAKVSPEERVTATLLPAVGFEEVDDVERAFEDWRAAVDQSEEPGRIRAFELQMDERGNVATTKMQIRLGSWPIDSYSFDELCTMLTRDFMDVGKNVMPVRLIGSRPGQRGVHFNKIVLLKRSVTKPVEEERESTAALLRAINEGNEKMAMMWQRMQAPAAAPPDAMAQMQQMLGLAAIINKPNQELMSVLIPALVGRPAPVQADPYAGFGSMLDGVSKIAAVMAGRGEDEGGEDDPDFVKILKAVTPLAKPALEAIPHIAAARMAQPAPIAALPPGATGPGNPPRPPAPAQQRTIDPTAVPSTPQPARPDLMATAPPARPTLLREDGEMYHLIKPVVDSLVVSASQGMKPELAAKVFFRDTMMNLPQEEWYGQICEAVESDTFVDELQFYNATTQAHRDWFSAFRTELIKYITQADAGETEKAPVATIVK